MGNYSLMIMFQTGYRGITTLAKGLPYAGGFCRWYYIAIEQLLSFPAIDPATQFLSAEPTISGSWCGPVGVPRDQLGFEEVIKRDKVGLYYQTKISGFQPGDDRINMENMPYHEFVVVGKMRAGGMHLIIGNDLNGLQFDANYKNPASASAGSEFAFSGEFLNKALILPSFAGDNYIPPGTGGSGSGGNGGGGSGGSTDSNDAEIIAYSTEDIINIEWTAERKERFGVYPVFEIWYTEEDTLRLSIASVITVDAFPPNTTLFTVTLNAPGPGIVVIK